MKTDKNIKNDKRAAALRDNLKRRKAKTKEESAALKTAAIQDSRKNKEE